MKNKYLYIYIDDTDKELPLYVCDSAKELAEKQACAAAERQSKIRLLPTKKTARN